MGGFDEDPSVRQGAYFTPQDAAAQRRRPKGVSLFSRRRIDTIADSHVAIATPVRVRAMDGPNESIPPSPPFLVFVFPMPTTTPTTRPATLTDIPAIVSLVNRAYRDEALRGWTSECDIVSGERTHAEEIKFLITEPGSELLVMLMDERIYGCVHLRSQGSEVYLGMLTIDPGYQNHGLGKELLRFGEEYAQEHMGGKSISMIVVGQRTELIDFYLRRGYKRSGDTLPYPIDQNVGQPKVDGLYLETLTKNI
jgi:ribosomal protein S18 acetylase RimI-like enzyme